ncbi:ABC transporter permease subunit [Paenibacillus sepulcri]|uniref:ABC transporter permease n=1 Tax=Paenibacillus sepulcri TaxID=359917 RepID=A0ABS7C0S3_9BACL|nr:ABC transporter permease [Paenibacillus sepulcri]
MKTSATFWALMRHEFKVKGNGKRLNRSPLSRKWAGIYGAVVLIIVLGTLTYFAMDHSLKLLSLWFVTIGFPYMLFFTGHGILKREWENETSGWWLTLPYSRLTLVGAKWSGAALRTLMAIAGFYAAASIYASCIVLILNSYTMSDLSAFLLVGLNWFVLIIGFGPFVLSIGFLTAAVVYTHWRPITPLLWVIFMGGGGLLFSKMGPVFDQLNGDAAVVWFPFPWEVLAAMIVSLPAAYLVIRLCAYLLDRKLA